MINNTKRLVTFGLAAMIGAYALGVDNVYARGMRGRAGGFRGGARVTRVTLKTGAHIKTTQKAAIHHEYHPTVTHNNNRFMWSYLMMRGHQNPQNMTQEELEEKLNTDPYVTKALGYRKETEIIDEQVKDYTKRLAKTKKEDLTAKNNLTTLLGRIIIARKYAQTRYESYVAENWLTEVMKAYTK